MLIMNVIKLKEEYENRISKILAWNKYKEPKYLKTIKYITIFLGIVLIIALIFLFIKFKNDSKEQIRWYVGIFLFELIYNIIICLYLKRKPENNLNSKKIISTLDKERLKSIRRLFIKENICFDDVNKVQIIIDELICRKKQVIPFYYIGKNIVNPLMIIFVPCLTVFLDHLTQSMDILFQASFLSVLLLVIIAFLALFFMIAKPIKWILYRKYDDFISDLKLLQITDNI